MKDISIGGNINFNFHKSKIKDRELSSLKFTDNLYKKDIEKFLKFLSSHFQ